MCLETVDITYEETGSELLALLKESADIKHLYPKYNRSQKRANESLGLFSYEDQKGILHLAYNPLKLVPNPIMKFYNVSECRNLLEKICEEYELCPKYCHLQTNVNSCFHYQIKKCKGICTEREAIETYNERVKLAIKSLGLQGEDLVIKEKGRTQNEMGFALILNGVYKGYGYMDNTIELSSPDDYLFYLQPQKDNRDVQRILSYYIHKKEAS
jgi:DNA polymerase-3 subunit epsilon